MKTVKTVIASFIFISTLMSCNGQATREQDEKIIGTWAGFLIDSESGEKMSPMKMEFTKDGQVNYTLDPGTDRQNEFSVAYWTKGRYLYTKNLESDEKEERAKYQIDGNTLTITTGKVANELVKQ